MRDDAVGGSELIGRDTLTRLTQRSNVPVGGDVVWFHLKFAALVSVAWVVMLLIRPADGALELVQIMSVPGAIVAGVVHAGLAVLFWWGSNDPPRRLGAVYTGMVVFAIRAAAGIYLVLYVLRGGPAMIVLVEMVLAIGLLSALINGLPAAVRPRG